VGVQGGRVKGVKRVQVYPFPSSSLFNFSRSHILPGASALSKDIVDDKYVVVIVAVQKLKLCMVESMIGCGDVSKIIFMRNGVEMVDMVGMLRRSSE
jgi:hypothetical protein